MTASYFYDSAGRLTKAVDSTGVAIQYVYDAAGNITQINRTTVGPFALLNFTPEQGAAGARITIQGTGFSTTPASNVVKFNGTVATVLSATATSIVAIVPTGATSGMISVQVGSNTVTSSDPFTLQASTPQNTPPVVTIVAPTSGATVLGGQVITLSATVTTANTITSLDYSVNGAYLITGIQSAASTFSRTFTIPYGVTALTIGARAFDNQANVGFAAPVTVTVSPGGTTTVSGTTANTINQAIVGASVSVLQDGLKAEYFTTTPPSQLSAIPTLGAADQTKPIPNLDFRNPDGGSGPLFGNDTFGISATNFAARFTGVLQVPAPGSYSFTLGAAASAQVILNGSNLITFNSNGTFGEKQGTITLAAGSIPIEVDYLNVNGQVPQLQLSWSSAVKAVGQRQVIPQASLQLPAGLFTGTSGTGGSYSIAGVPVSLGQIGLAGLYQTKSGSSGYFSPVAGGTTNAGTLIIGVAFFQSVVVGGLRSCGIGAGGLAYCWGYNISGELGMGSNSGPNGFGWNHPIAVVAPSGSSVLNFSSIAVGKTANSGTSVCGITVGGLSYCWGKNLSGQLGNGGNGDSYVPVAVVSAMGSESLSQIAVGGALVCGITGSGRGYCWGNGDAGDLGNGSGTNTSYNTPQVVSGAVNFASIALSDMDTVLSMNTSGAGLTWGAAANGSFFDPSGTAVNFSTIHPSPTPIVGPVGQGPLTFSAVTSGGGFAFFCGIEASTSAAYCWGNNGNGQLGNGSTDRTDRPIAVSAPAGGSVLAFAKISAGISHTCGITTSGATYCWGANGSGQLGTGDTVQYTVPTLVQPPAGVSTPLPFVSVGAGASHTCGLTFLGTAYCWGDNGNGELGNGGTSGSLLPVVVVSP